MRNDHHFVDLIPGVLRSVPYILQSHGCKGYLALENLRAEHPHWPAEVWEHAVSVIRDDELKVEGLLAAELLELPAFFEPVAGRTFGPDWILARGLMPLSYWAMRRKVLDQGFETVFREVLARSLDRPIYLGHELSVLASYGLFHRSILEPGAPDEYLEFFIQRFTEFVHVTFDERNAWGFEHPEVSELPSEGELLGEALANPGFFGHNVLAHVWTQRLRPWLDADAYRAALHSLTVQVRWEPFDEVKAHLIPLEVPVDAATLDARFRTFFLEGPRNIHQVTLADALWWVWCHHPEHRGLVLANLDVFTRGTRPPVE